MKYRKFGKMDWEVSVLGFGAMRFPLKNGNPADIDEPEAIRMMHYAFDHGVNYIDSGYVYHEGRSEALIGRALQDGYREKVKVATKLPAFLIESIDQCDRIFKEQLERLQIDKIDFYLLHGLNIATWSKLRDMEIFSWAEDALAAGHIEHLGFSFHDNFNVFKEIVDAYDNWTLCQIQYNYMDTEFQAGTRGLKYAADKGLAVVIMEPIRGGRLAQSPETITRLWDGAPRQRSQAEWALQWVWNHPEVSVALSGMSTMEQVVENIASADRSGPGILTADELALIGQVREAYRTLNPVPCTGCGYCMPCPSGVDIPRIFNLYNDAVIYDDTILPRMIYRGAHGFTEDQRADRCIECGDCLEICPQEFPIPAYLQKAHELLKPRE